VITVSRGNERQRVVLLPGRRARRLFPSPGAVMFDQAALGAENVLSGWNHMLFLLVVLPPASAGGRWRWP
jgi:hypothetical protein